MANSLSTNPWVIDTPGATILTSNDIKVAHFEFAGYAAQGNIATVQDRYGKVIWTSSGEADLTEVRSGTIASWLHGLAVTQLDGGGILRVYIL